MANFGPGHGSTKRERPRRAFEGARESYTDRLDFGKSKIPESGVYRARWTEKPSMFWTIVKVLILGFILYMIVGALLGFLK